MLILSILSVLSTLLVQYIANTIHSQRSIHATSTVHVLYSIRKKKATPRKKYAVFKTLITQLLNVVFA